MLVTWNPNISQLDNSPLELRNTTFRNPAHVIRPSDAHLQTPYDAHLITPLDADLLILFLSTNLDLTLDYALAFGPNPQTNVSQCSSGCS